MDKTFEAHCRLLMRAYPRRYREFREDELLGTLLETAEPGRRKPSFRDSWALIAGGLLHRLRDRPPLHWWLAYRFLFKRLPYRYRWWARDEILGRFHTPRRYSFLLALVISLETGLPIHGDSSIYERLWEEARWSGLGAALAIVFYYVLGRGNPKVDKGLALARYEFYSDGHPFQGTPPPPPKAEQGFRDYIPFIGYFWQVKRLHNHRVRGEKYLSFLRTERNSHSIGKSFGAAPSSSPATIEEGRPQDGEANR